jgi:hypothetical protein
MTDVYYLRSLSWQGWSSFSVPALAEILDEDLSVAWSQVQAWRDTHDLVSQHRDLLQRARASLASAWPPERSPAAARFFGVTDALIESMQEMQDVAVANHGALNGVLASLDQARTTVDGLYEKWKAEPSGGKMAGPHPPLTAGQKALNAQAHDQMDSTDNAISDSGSHMAVPTPYGLYPVEPGSIPYSGGDQASRGSTGSSSGSGSPVRPPAIPPVPSPAYSTALDGEVLSGGPRADQGGADSGRGVVHDSLDPHGLPPGLSIGSAFPAAEPTVGSWFVATPGGRALRAGAVIGDPGHDVSTPQRIGQQSVRSGVLGTEENAIDRRANPVGGLLGSGPVSSVGGREKRHRRSMPLDTDWEVRRGVPPVLEPGPEPYHDPGLGVIGIDR